MTYVFGVFEMDDGSLELRKAGRIVALEPQPARALALLLSRAGEIVTREELSACIWGAGTHVDFNRGLAYCIAQIRAALGDSGDNPRFIQTLPKRGFRFVAPVVPANAAVPSPMAPTVVVPTFPPLRTLRRVSPKLADVWRAAADRSAYSLRLAVGAAAMLLLIVAVPFAERAVSRRSRPIVAVSIFDNETGDARYDRAVHALSDAVVDRLTQLGPDELCVVGNASILRMPRNKRDLQEIKDQTGASHVVLAQLQPRTGELSLLMHLIKLEDGTHVWTRRIARRLPNSLDGLDDEAASTISAGVQAHLLARNP